MEKRTPSVGDLFHDEPFQWGLRGDPGLWEALRAYFARVPLPRTVRHLRALVADAFLEITGKPLSTKANFYLEQFDRGGMSAGMISMDFWNKDALPMLVRGFRSLRRKG